MEVKKSKEGLINWEYLDSILPKEGTIGYRIMQILAVIAMIIGVIAWVIFKLILVMIWFIVSIIDLILFIPCGILWVFSGEFYGMRLSLYIGKKFKVLETNG